MSLLSLSEQVALELNGEKDSCSGPQLIGTLCKSLVIGEMSLFFLYLNTYHYLIVEIE